MEIRAQVEKGRAWRQDIQDHVDVEQDIDHLYLFCK
jgi:hypothetical protein